MYNDGGRDKYVSDTEAYKKSLWYARGGWMGPLPEEKDSEIVERFKDYKCRRKDETGWEMENWDNKSDITMAA